MNTAEVELGYTAADELRGPAEVRDLLTRYAGLTADDPVRPRDVERVRGLREALRTLLLHNGGGPPDDGAVALLNRVAEDARLLPQIADDGSWTFTPRSRGVTAALGRIVAAVFTAMSDGSWERLKACPSETCLWAFFDRSKNRSKTWCSMSVCGNREKARAYRERQGRTTP